MRRKTAEKWLSAAMDRELSPRRTRRLERYLARHGAQRALRTQWEAVGDAVRTWTPPPGKTAEAAWQDVRRDIRRREPVRKPGPLPFASPWRWATGTLTVLLTGVAVAYVTWRAWPGRQEPAAVMEAPDVEWVETELAGATPMVYQDTETGWTVIWVLAPEEDDEHAGS